MATLRAHANRVGLRTPSHEHAAVPSNRPLGPLRQGLEWVAQNHIRPAVVHMSVEGQSDADLLHILAHDSGEWVSGVGWEWCRMEKMIISYR